MSNKMNGSWLGNSLVAQNSIRLQLFSSVGFVGRGGEGGHCGG